MPAGHVSAVSRRGAVHPKMCPTSNGGCDTTRLHFALSTGASAVSGTTATNAVSAAAATTAVSAATPALSATVAAALTATIATVSTAAKGDIKVSRAATGVERCADARASQRHVCEMHAQLRAGGPGEERPLWQLNDEGTRLAGLAVDEVAEAGEVIGGEGWRRC